jgi:hypothetical protein
MICLPLLFIAGSIRSNGAMLPQGLGALFNFQIANRNPSALSTSLDFFAPI